MLDMLHSQLYASPKDHEILKGEPDYVQKRYYTIIKTILVTPFRWTRQQAADFLHISKRHMQRLVHAFKIFGIPGLRFKSKARKAMPNKSPERTEKAVIEMRKLTGFGTSSISTLVNEQFRMEGYDQTIGSSLAYKICMRNGLLEPSKPVKTDWKKFDWKRPNNLLQSDLTQFNGVPILAMEDDHSRFVWSDAIDNESAETIAEAMHELGPDKFNNLLTDNGPQFSKKNPFFLKYLNDHVRESHIRSSISHPQTLGKMSAYQKGLKGFLGYKLGDCCNRFLIKPLIKAYNLFYNNGRRNRIAKGIPAEKYSGRKDGNWFPKMMRILKFVTCGNIRPANPLTGWWYYDSRRSGARRLASSMLYSTKQSLRKPLDKYSWRLAPQRLNPRNNHHNSLQWTVPRIVCGPSALPCAREPRRSAGAKRAPPSHNPRRVMPRGRIFGPKRHHIYKPRHR